MNRLIRWLLLALALMTATLAALWWWARPATPDAFYTQARPWPQAPGVLLRQEEFTRQVPAGARAWRILYTTRTTAGAPALSSAIVMVASNAPPGPRPVVAWTHGTTGAVLGCAPSLLDQPFANVPALSGLLDRGWLLVATDYTGLATAGQHGYLIGPGQAYAALDALRALRAMPEVQAGERTVVWGHSQGGHAALWTGQLAPSYAPELAIAGVAAAAPASDLRALIDAAHPTPIGRILSAYVVRAYADTYPDVRWDALIASPLRRWLVRDLSARCLAGAPALVAVAQALALGGSVFDAPPGQGALGARLAENTPNSTQQHPLLVAQGEIDTLVLPAIQSRWVARRCAAGQVLSYRRYPGLDHLGLVAPDSPFGTDLLRWTEDRFADRPAPRDCPVP